MTLKANTQQPTAWWASAAFIKIAQTSLLMACAAPAFAQLYKIVGPDGKITYSDTPPISSTAKVERKSIGNGNTGNANLPFELNEAVRNNPVIIYTSRQCAPCDDARALLRQRGVPYSEKTVNTNEDQVKLRQVGGDLQIPLLIVGRSKLRGFEAGAWQAALDGAKYPETNRLPNNYVFRAPEPAAPPVEAPKPTPALAPTPAPAAEPAKPPPPPQPPDNKTPPGFLF